MKIIQLLTIIFLIALSIYPQEVFKGDLFISDIHSECIDTTFIAGKMISLNPPEFEYQKDKLVYELTITIKLYGNEFTYNNAIALTFRTPDNNVITQIINQELYNLGIDEYYDFVLHLQSRENGWVNVELHEWDMYNLHIVNNFNVNFINYSFYLD